MPSHKWTIYINPPPKAQGMSENNGQKNVRIAGVSKMAKQAKVFAAKPGDLISVPRIYMAGEN